MAKGLRNPHFRRLTAAERAKRYRQRKVGNKVATSPRSARRADIEILWLAESRCSLRTFYRQRSRVLWFAQNATDEQLIERLTAAPEITQYIRNHMIVEEWAGFLTRLDALGIAVEDKRHPLDSQ